MSAIYNDKSLKPDTRIRALKPYGKSIKQGDTLTVLSKSSKGVTFKHERTGDTRGPWTIHPNYWELVEIPPQRKVLWKL